MGRAFEYRKARKMKRWANMARTFTKVGREIAIAVKEGGPEAEYNPRLRLAIQNAKAANMPKANVENAIKRASSKDAADYQEVVFEGYAPHGVAVIVETATDNNTRTVADVRHVFSKYGGSLGVSGSVDYQFERRGLIKIKADATDPEELELELIDFGLEEMAREEEEEGEELLLLYSAFLDYAKLQKALEERGLEIVESSLIRQPLHGKSLADEEAEAVIRLLDKMEELDDVVNVFHNMDMDDQ